MVCDKEVCVRWRRKQVRRRRTRVRSREVQIQKQEPHTIL